MKRSAFEIEVAVVDGNVYVSQQLGFDDRNTVVISPDQAELFAKWVLDAAKVAAELDADKEQGAAVRGW